VDDEQTGSQVLIAFEQEGDVGELTAVEYQYADPAVHRVVAVDHRLGDKHSYESYAGSIWHRRAAASLAGVERDQGWRGHIERVAHD
jgi:hypothetical protein